MFESVQLQHLQAVHQKAKQAFEEFDLPSDFRTTYLLGNILQELEITAENVKTLRIEKRPDSPYTYEQRQMVCEQAHQLHVKQTLSPEEFFGALSLG